MFKKIRNKVNSIAVKAQTAVANKKAEGYVDSGVKILIAVVIGALLLAKRSLKTNRNSLKVQKRILKSRLHTRKN